MLCYAMFISEGIDKYTQDPQDSRDANPTVQLLDYKYRAGELGRARRLVKRGSQEHPAGLYAGPPPKQTYNMLCLFRTVSGAFLGEVVELPFLMRTGKVTMNRELKQ